MPTSSPPPQLSEEDFEAISSAVMETARGRWFLAEYSRRNRNADTDQVLSAIGRLEAAMAARSAGGVDERIRLDIIDMASAIARTKAEIAAMLPPDQSGHIGDASNELDAIVRSTETATGEILAAAEHLQEVAWTLREQGYQGAACEIIDQRATDIYTACSFQDITGQRTQKVIQILRYLEDRLNAMMAIWGGEKPEQPVPAFKPRDSLVNGPALPGEGLAQSRVDEMMASGAAPLAIEFEPVPVTPSAPPLAIEFEPLPVPPPAPPPPPLALELERVPVPAAPSPPALPPPLALSAPPSQPPVIEPATVPVSIALRASVAPESPFSPPVRPKPRPPEKPVAKVTPIDTRPAATPPTITDIEALPFEERAALFS